MTKLYMRMALTNIRKNRKLYTPYLLACILEIMMLYIVCSMTHNENILDMWGGNIIQSYLKMGRFIIAIFAVIFTFYINSFLLKRRKKEFGLYNILGLEKKHINKILFFETLYTYIGTVAAGFAAGVLFDKLMYLILLKILGAEVKMGFYVSFIGLKEVAALFGIIFFLVLLKAMREIAKAKPIELLKGSEEGEKEPKARWILALLGAACVLTGYVISITTQNAIAAFMLFFVAVALVIIGTYLLFTTGSIAILKLLKKKKGYYYKTSHFISISSMMYRMKKNAVGLANICILSTMVIIMLSATLNIFVGANDGLHMRYPAEFSVTAEKDNGNVPKIISNLDREIAKAGLEKQNEIQYEDLTFAAVYDKQKERFEIDSSAYDELSIIQLYNTLSNLMFVSLDDYNRTMGTNETLSSYDEVLLYTNKGDLSNGHIKVMDFDFKVAGKIDKFMESPKALTSLTSTYFVVVKDDEVLEDLYRAQEEILGKNSSFIWTTYMTDIKGHTKSAKEILGIKFYEEESSEYTETIENIYAKASEGTNFISQGYFDCRTAKGGSYFLDFFGLYFLGIFLGILFIMAMILIVYYKQVTEGYEDKKRFEILQNVGLSQTEVKKTINSQILTVFFLPLITAGVHTAVAFPFIFRIMTLLGLLNMNLFAFCAAVVFIVYALLYIIVYKLTARAYYNIVKNS